MLLLKWKKQEVTIKYDGKIIFRKVSPEYRGSLSEVLCNNLDVRENGTYVLNVSDEMLVAGLIGELDRYDMRFSGAKEEVNRRCVEIAAEISSITRAS